jgi:hypothetical protein
LLRIGGRRYRDESNQRGERDQAKVSRPSCRHRFDGHSFGSLHVVPPFEDSLFDLESSARVIYQRDAQSLADEARVLLRQPQGQLIFIGPLYSIGHNPHSAAMQYVPSNILE